MRYVACSQWSEINFCFEGMSRSLAMLVARHLLGYCLLLCFLFFSLELTNHLTSSEEVKKLLLIWWSVHTCPHDPVSHWAQDWLLHDWMLLGRRSLSHRSSSGQVTMRCCSPPPHTSEHWTTHTNKKRHSLRIWANRPSSLSVLQ